MQLTKHDPDSEKMLANMDQASYALGQARSIAEIKHVHDIAEAAKRYAKAADLCNEAYVMASVVAADARRKAGEMLMQLEKGQGGRPEKNTCARAQVSEYNEVLHEINLPRFTAAKWQQEARVPDDVYQDIKQNALDNGKELSQRNVLKVVKDIEFEKRQDDFQKPIGNTSTVAVCYHGNCLDYLKTDIPMIDLLLTDPPYAMDYKSGWNDWDKIHNDKRSDTSPLLDEAFKRAKTKLADDAHIYVFGNPNEIETVKPIFTKYFVLKNILIWDRNVIGMGDLKTYGRSYDVIYFGYNKTWKDLNGTRDRDVLEFNRVSPNELTHPTEKPASILEYIIKKSTNEGGNVLDPFAGSCTTLKAANDLGRNAYGSELENKYIPSWILTKA